MPVQPYTLFSGSPNAVSAAPSNQSLVITGASESGTTATLTTIGNHNFLVGQWVHVQGVSVNGYNGQWQVASVPFPFSLTFVAAASGLATVGSGGTAALIVTPIGTPAALAAVAQSYVDGWVAATGLATDGFSIDNLSAYRVSAWAPLGTNWSSGNLRLYLWHPILQRWGRDDPSFDLPLTWGTVTPENGRYWPDFRNTKRGLGYRVYPKFDTAMWTGGLAGLLQTRIEGSEDTLAL